MIQSIAASYVTQWQMFATSKTGAHLTLAYNMDSTWVASLLVLCACRSRSVRWGLSYNLYGDKLLGLNLFPQSVYQMREFIPAPCDAIEADANFRDCVVRHPR